LLNTGFDDASTGTARLLLATSDHRDKPRFVGTAGLVHSAIHDDAFHPGPPHSLIHGAVLSRSLQASQKSVEPIVQISADISELDLAFVHRQTSSMHPLRVFRKPRHEAIGIKMRRTDRYIVAGVGIAAFFRNRADSEPSRCSHERKQHDEPKSTRQPNQAAGQKPGKQQGGGPNPGQQSQAPGKDNRNPKEPLGQTSDTDT
jgi:hypothetical protein